MSETIKVLNIAQPNAHNIIFGDKNVENRSQITYFRGTIAIYASATYRPSWFKDIDLKKEDCEYGKIIGFVDIVDCIIEEEVTDKTHKWFYGPYGYVLENPRFLKEPVEVRPPTGAVVWWNLEGDFASQCLSQIDMSKYKSVVKIDADPAKPILINKKKGKYTPSLNLSSITGFASISFNDAYEALADYADEYGLFYYENDDESNIQNFRMRMEELFSTLSDREVVNYDEFLEIIESNLEICDVSDFIPPKELEIILGKKAISLKQAFDKLEKYLDRNDLFVESDDPDEYLYLIKCDDVLREFTKKDTISYKELGRLLRDSFEF
ncbi:hypothetical protein [Halobacteriovorax sp. ZH5_bin.2]|uniref:hypothetical protein n=1 Tax=Halobacteriovorax sp. ZH5_bin.2 TaxID=3157727 RepID=UPI0037183E83